MKKKLKNREEKRHFEERVNEAIFGGVKAAMTGAVLKKKAEE